MHLDTPLLWVAMAPSLLTTTSVVATLPLVACWQEVVPCRMLAGGDANAAQYCGQFLPDVCTQRQHGQPRQHRGTSGSGAGAGLFHDVLTRSEGSSDMSGMMR